MVKHFGLKLLSHGFESCRKVISTRMICDVQMIGNNSENFVWVFIFFTNYLTHRLRFLTNSLRPLIMILSRNFDIDCWWSEILGVLYEPLIEIRVFDIVTTIRGWKLFSTKFMGVRFKLNFLLDTFAVGRFRGSQSLDILLKHTWRHKSSIGLFYCRAGFQAKTEANREIV